MIATPGRLQTHHFPTAFRITVGVYRGRTVRLPPIPFQAIDWGRVPTAEHPGESGVAVSRTLQFGDVRVRLVEYSPGYRADHWCSKGHILLCLDGELRTELATGETVALSPGMSYQVGDNVSPHRSHTDTGARLFIVD